MKPEFIDRAQELENLCRLVRIRSTRPRVIAVDSPAGMGKTLLLIETCRRLIEDADQRREEWQIVRLDFRADFQHSSAESGVPYQSERDVLEEIARQLCRDPRWAHISGLIREADPQDVILIQQAARIPMEDPLRRALLQLVSQVSPETLSEINGVIASAFDEAPLQSSGPLRSVAELVRFVQSHCDPPDSRSIPQRVLVVLDGVDAVADARLRRWIVNELARTLATDDSLQHFFFERLAVIVAGRFILEEVNPSWRNHDYVEIVLRSFANKTAHVEDLIMQFEDTVFNRDGDLVNRLARKLCQVCGGHPKVIKETATELHARPGRFSALAMDPNGPNYWYGQPRFHRDLTVRRKATIGEILSRVDERDQCLLELLTAFRIFNHATLEFLARKIHENRIQKYEGYLRGDIQSLYQGLKDMRLIGRDRDAPIFDSDRFSLNLLSAQLHDEDPHLFRLLHEWAVELYADWISGRFSEDPTVPLRPNETYQQVAVREWLYHRLHLAPRCADYRQADDLGQTISAQLVVLLQRIVPFPFKTATDQKRLIREDVEADEEIHHLMWEVALEDKGRRDVIQHKILQAFQEEEDVR